MQASYYFGMYGFLSAICIVFSMISTPSGQYAGSKARRYLHDELLHAVVHKSLHFFQVTPFGRVMNRFSTDMAVIDKVRSQMQEVCTLLWFIYLFIARSHAGICVWDVFFGIVLGICIG